jgi:hypothetical protein
VDPVGSPSDTSICHPFKARTKRTETHAEITRLFTDKTTDGGSLIGAQAHGLDLLIVRMTRMRLILRQQIPHPDQVSPKGGTANGAVKIR